MITLQIIQQNFIIITLLFGTFKANKSYKKSPQHPEDSWEKIQNNGKIYSLAVALKAFGD